MTNFFRKYKLSITGGAVTACFTGAGALLIGNLSGYEAKQLLSSSLSGFNMLCNTAILASSTILALLLTLISVSATVDSEFRRAHYEGLLSIAKLDTTLFILTLIIFQFFKLPIMETEQVPSHWFVAIYWGVLICSSLISGLMVAVILMLYKTVSNIIGFVGFGEEHILRDAGEDPTM